MREERVRDVPLIEHDFESCSGRDFLITEMAQSISKRPTPLERVIKELHFLFCKQLDIFLIDFKNEPRHLRIT